MPQQEFFPDSKPCPTPEEQNADLAAQLCNAPLRYYKIIRIERNGPARGWDVTHER